MRLWLDALFSFFAICLLSACGEDNSGERTTWDPAKPRAVLGKAMIGVDDRFIVLCSNRQACAEQPICALDMNDHVVDALRAYHVHPAGEYWIAGHAIVASPGIYGHLGDRACLVTFNDVTGVDDGPPRLWSPPPPAKSSGR